jgi:thymidine kinase
MPGPLQNHPPNRKTDPARADDRTPPIAALARRGMTTLIAGCMFAGKTSDVLDRLRRYPADRRIAFKHVIDNRYRTDAIVSHNGDHLPAVTVTDAGQIPGKVVDGIEIAAIEEAHFFGMPLLGAIEALTARGVNVLVTGLELDTWGRPFPVMQRLADLADERTVKRPVCVCCGAPADHSQRLTPIVDGRLVGGPESYEPRCANCWHPPPERPPVEPQ